MNTDSSADYLKESVLMSSRREVPEVPLGVPDSILPLTIGLVGRRRIDDRSCTFGMMIVTVYVLDEDDETTWLGR